MDVFDDVQRVDVADDVQGVGPRWSTGSEHRGPRGFEHADSALRLGGTRRPAIAGDLLNRRGRGAAALY